MNSIAYNILSVRPENVGKMPFVHGYSCFYLTLKLQTSAWLACNFFLVNSYFLMRSLSDVPTTPVLFIWGKESYLPFGMEAIFIPLYSFEMPLLSSP